jgi:hypothetical protein
MMRLKVIYTLVLALVVLSVPAVGQKSKSKKVKDKRFETVVRENPKDYEGTYIGIEPDYVLEIEVTADGLLKVHSLEDGRKLTLANIHLRGARLTADKVYEDGRREKFEGTFSNRILNGVSAFGIIVEDMHVNVGSATLTRVFYQRN